MGVAIDPWLMRAPLLGDKPSSPLTDAPRRRRSVSVSTSAWLQRGGAALGSFSPGALLYRLLLRRAILKL